MLRQRTSNTRSSARSKSNGREKKGAERRRSERLPLGIPVFVRGIDERGKEFQEFTTAFNISSGGALVATKRYLPSSSLISLEIPSAPLPNLEAPPVFIRNLPAQPVMVAHQEHCYLVGLKFSKPLHRLAKAKVREKKFS
ncbi:MAG: PilZ domain-containing protein [Terriglobia bacterium]